MDLGIAEQAPVAALPFMAYVRIHMRAPCDDGLSSQQEFDALIKVEDLLTDTVCSEFVGYVGRNTSNGCRDFYFYVSSPDRWSGAVDQALSGSGYEFETGTREDAAWSSYLQFLMPAPRDRERMQNRRVCEALERQGDRLEEHRDIDHWSYFPNESAASAFLVEAQSLGYRVRVEPSSVKDGSQVCVQVYRSDLPAYGQIDSITLPLFDAALRHGGEYSGWECEVRP